MRAGNELKKAMIDSDIKTYGELSKKSDVSIDRIKRVMDDKPSVKLIDVVNIAKCFGLKLQFTSIEGEV